MKEVKNTYCSYCGAVFTMASWPRDCVICGNTTWQNPLPVAIVAANVIGTNGYEKGYVLIRRSIEPNIGELAFPGGYLEVGETWQKGAAREMLEETGIEINPNEIKLHSVVTSPVSSNLIIFCETVIEERHVKFIPNDEVSEIVISPNLIQLAFPMHTEVLRSLLTDV